MNEIENIAGLLQRHAPANGMHNCALPRVVLIRSSTPTTPMPVVYEPSVCLIAQGRKQVLLGDELLVYDRERYLIGTLDLPVMGAVIEATPAAPYLCVQYKFDLAALSALALEMGMIGGTSRSAPSLGLHRVTPDLADAFFRLLSLLKTPSDIPVMAPLIEREILYRLAKGPAADFMRRIAASDSSLARVSRVIGWIKAHFNEPVSVVGLAELAGMSPSSLHAHFKSVTRMSPLRYRTLLRLQEARRLMVAEGCEAAQAGFRVGYDSPSQFSREYRRLYGAAPARDADRVRNAGGETLAAP